ncbi:IS607 family transposase [Sulfodiicoccus acidiphilus]|uniref:IS607 family transposase n=1 Tax=Sulfodiicoccus acidiphilus TaxID=1670455 RepID=A0A348B5W4_9CREN|nr:IS607 family transposase [Sulfodiicoccus acidiphilus]
MMGIVRKRKILYARISSNTRRDDLVNQVKYLQEQVKDYDQVITDVGSGLNAKRKGFLKLLRMILNNEVSKVVIAYSDRLVRFGFEIVEEVCKARNCELVVLNNEDETPEQELIEDLISILVSFGGKLYGMRSHKYEKVKECVEELN